jgi:hypothetical protein
VIECKRTDNDWIFLTHPPPQEAPSKARFRWIKPIFKPGQFPVGHSDFPLTKGVLNSEFCVVQGQGKEKPLLEHISGNLLDSTEALASEDSNTSLKFSQDIVRVYIPVLVTTASLVCAPIDPEKISLSRGHVDEARFEEVEAVLFRKSFAADRVRSADALSLRLSKRARERSVLVVSAQLLTEVLIGFKIHWTWLKDEHQDRLPWD